jgi:hypothetical protein
MTCVRLDCVDILYVQEHRGNRENEMTSKYNVTRHDGIDESKQIVIHKTTPEAAREIANQKKAEEPRGSSTHYTVDKA